jgi:hypothetical protein
VGAEMTGHWDGWVIWICEEDSVSPNRGLSISRLSRKSCTAMSQPKDIPVLGIPVWRYPRITMLDIHHCGGETEYSFLEIGFREEELWMLFSAVLGFCDTPMEQWDISCEVAGSSDNQREARAKAWS